MADAGLVDNHSDEHAHDETFDQEHYDQTTHQIMNKLVVIPHERSVECLNALKESPDILLRYELPDSVPDEYYKFDIGLKGLPEGHPFYGYKISVSCYPGVDFSVFATIDSSVLVSETAIKSPDNTIEYYDNGGHTPFKKNYGKVDLVTTLIELHDLMSSETTNPATNTMHLDDDDESNEVSENEEENEFIEEHVVEEVIDEYIGNAL